MKDRVKWKAIIITLVASLLLGYVSITFFGEYGWTIFVLVPLLIGFLPPYIVSKDRRLSWEEGFNLSFFTLFLACLCLLLFALEGIICILMAAPILLFCTLVGTWIAYSLQGEKGVNQKNTTLLLIFSALGFMSIDHLNEPQELIPVETQVIINAPIAEVWNNVVTFSKIEEPTEWIFKTGIAYPIEATIEGTGVGAIRYCNFTTGSFVEPITVWQEPTLLAFDVKEQPIPMNEYNPFWDIHPPHLDGYFKSHKGQFLLTAIDEHTTALQGTTWYTIDITPEVYWRSWSAFILHKVHYRVLEHIKKETEKK